MEAPAPAKRSLAALAQDLRHMDDIIPSDPRTLRACMYCYLVKSVQQVGTATFRR